MRHSDFTFEQKEELAKLYYPHEYAAAKTSKRRRNLRVAAAERCIEDYYKSLGRSCGNCVSYSEGICWMQSDFYGNVHTTSSDICSAHNLR